MGDPDKVALRAALEASGWDVERIERDDWWVFESWRLTSTWRPQGASAYVTLILRPDSDTSRPSRIADVSYVAVTHEPPSFDRFEASRAAIGVSPWPDRLRDVVAAATALRPSS